MHDWIFNNVAFSEINDLYYWKEPTVKTAYEQTKKIFKERKEKSICVSLVDNFYRVWWIINMKAINQVIPHAVCMDMIHYCS